MNVNFHIGEVIESTSIDTYIQNKNHDFSVMVRTYITSQTMDLYCMPANGNIKQIPLVGEHVLIFQGTNSISDVDKLRHQWYYFPAYNIQSSVNNNRLPGVAKLKPSDINDPDHIPEVGSFKQKSVSLLQQFEGDVIIEGRFSNSIRLGSTVNGGNYTLQPTWIGDGDGDPIIIISNEHKDKKKKLTIENIKDDESSLYLTSKQRLPKLKLYNQLTKSKSQTAYDKSQIIGSANRIILTAKQDSIILDSRNRITLNTKETRIGKESADHALVKGDVLRDILNDLIDAIQSGVLGPAGMYSFPEPGATSKLQSIKRKIGKLNSINHYFDK